MSKQRQRDRAAREAAQQQARSQADDADDQTQRARDAATRAAVDAGRRPASSRSSSAPGSRGKAAGSKGRQPVYRQRRFPPLPWRLKLALALGWLSVFALSLVLVSGWQGRIGIMVVATFSLPLIVVIVRDPSRRTR